MSLAVKPGKSIKHELQRITRKELGNASTRLLKEERNEEDVHDGRTSVKKVEAVAKLLDGLGFRLPPHARKDLRDAKRALSILRDADAVIETFDHLRARFSHRISRKTSTAIHAQLARRKAMMTKAVRSGVGTLARSGKALGKIERAARRWQLPATDLSDLPAVLKRSYRASRKAMERAQTRERAEDFHEWRKTVKMLWYQLRLVERLVSGLTKQIAEFKELQTALGEEHNLVVLRLRLTHDRALKSNGAELDRVTAMSAALQEELQRAALVLGKRLFRLSPKEFAKDLEQRLRPKGTPRRKPAPGTRGQAVA